MEPFLARLFFWGKVCITHRIYLQLSTLAENWPVPDSIDKREPHKNYKNYGQGPFSASPTAPLGDKFCLINYRLFSIFTALIAHHSRKNASSSATI